MNDEKNASRDSLPDWVIRVGVRIFFVWLAVFTVPWLFYWLPNWFGIDGHRLQGVLSQLGTLGDLFGSVNTLFSAMALVGAAYAVTLQREELSHTKQSSDDDAESRAMSMRMQAEQSRNLLAAARFNAALTITQSQGLIAQITNGSRTAYQALAELREANQYARIIQIDIDVPDSAVNWNLIPETQRTPYYKYLVVWLKAAAQSANNGLTLGDSIDSRGLIEHVCFEMKAFLGQYGVIGTPLGDRAQSIYRTMTDLKNQILKDQATFAQEHPSPGNKPIFESGSLYPDDKTLGAARADYDKRVQEWEENRKEHWTAINQLHIKQAGEIVAALFRAADNAVL